MKKLFFVLLTAFLLNFAVFAQINGASSSAAAAPNATTAQNAKKRPPIFRASKDQIVQAQKILRINETGKLNSDMRDALKTYQAANGLRATGTLNRATLEKMNVALSAKQLEIPVSPNSFARPDESDKTGSGSVKKRGPVFATKEQIMQAQKMLRESGVYGGGESGKLDDATREGLKKFQTSNGMKETGTLNRATLEKMGIQLTDRQKEL